MRRVADVDRGDKTHCTLTGVNLGLSSARLSSHRRRASGCSRRQGARPCRASAHRWVARFRAEGVAGLADHFLAPPLSAAHPGEVEQRVLQLRREQGRGQDWIGPELDVASRTVSAILVRPQESDRLECAAQTCCSAPDESC